MDLNPKPFRVTTDPEWVNREIFQAAVIYCPYEGKEYGVCSCYDEDMAHEIADALNALEPEKAAKRDGAAR
jgi:hypothetical protein